MGVRGEIQKQSVPHHDNGKTKKFLHATNPPQIPRFVRVDDRSAAPIVKSTLRHGRLGRVQNGFYIHGDATGHRGMFDGLLVANSCTFVVPFVSLAFLLIL